MTAYDGDKNPIEDPTIATLKFELKSWNILDETKGAVQWKLLKTKMCEDADFNTLDNANPDSKFLPLAEQAVPVIDIYGSKMKCLDEEELELFGNFDTNSGANLLVTLEKCDRTLRNDCKDDAIIDAWLKYKYIVIL